MWRKSLNDSADHSLRAPLGLVNNLHYNLREVTNYPGVMPVLVNALKNKGVRFDELSFEDGEITYLNQNVVVLRGAAYEVVHRAFHGGEHRLTRKQVWQKNLRVFGFAMTNRLLALNLVNRIKTGLKSGCVIFHKRSLPNFKQCIPQPAAPRPQQTGACSRQTAGYTAVELSR